MILSKADIRALIETVRLHSISTVVDTTPSEMKRIHQAMVAMLGEFNFKGAYTCCPVCKKSHALPDNHNAKCDICLAEKATMFVEACANCVEMMDEMTHEPRN